MTPLATTSRTRLTRLRERARTDRADLYAVLDAGLICHVGLVVDGAPVVIPTGYGRLDDTLYLHGSTGAGWLRRAAGAPVCATVLAAATKFRDGSTTSSPSPQPAARRAMCNAAVPFATANACGTSVAAANRCSNSATRGPMLHQPERTASSTARRRSSSTSTSESGTTHRGASTAQAYPRGFPDL